MDSDVFFAIVASHLGIGQSKGQNFFIANSVSR